MSGMLTMHRGCEPLTPEDIAEFIVFAAGRRENVVVAESLSESRTNLVMLVVRLPPQCSIGNRLNKGVSVIHPHSSFTASSMHRR